MVTKSISRQLAAAILPILVGSFLLLGAATYVTVQIKERIAELSQQSFLVLETLGRIQETGLEILNAANEVAFLSVLKRMEDAAAAAGTQPSMEKSAAAHLDDEMEEINEAIAGFQEANGAYRKLVSEFFPNEMWLSLKISETGTRLVRLTRVQLEQSRSGVSFSETMAGREAYESVEEDFLQYLAEAIESERKELTDGIAELDQTLTRANYAIWGSFALVFGFGSLFGFGVARNIVQRLRGLRTAVEQITDINLDVRANVHGQDELSDLAIGFNNMAESLQVMVEVRDEAEDNLQTLAETLEVQVTERTEELRGALKKAETANEVKTAFLSSMSHELRTPLNAVIGFSQLLADDPEQPLSEDQADSVQQITRAGTHLLNLINEVLDLSKIEEGVLGVEVDDVDLDAMTEECMNLLANAAGANNITVRGECPPGFLVRSDYTKLKQVVLNLMSNAVKYNRPDGQVTLTVATPQEGWFSVAVADTGYGIAEEHIDELFQPFVRFGQESSDIEGTGIGLVISDKLVRLLGGHIDVSSEVGVGSCFTAHLPTESETSGDS